MLFDCHNNNSNSVIHRLHDQAGSTSCYMLAGRASSMFARRLLDVCSIV